MFEIYQEKVLDAYRNKAERNQLPQLSGISPALLRNECLNLYKERKGNEKDAASLRTFFGPDENKKGYLKIIDEYPTGKFRSLSNFFQGRDVKPDRKNIELLAWLIDFQPRPYQALSGYEISSSLNKDDLSVEPEKVPDVLDGDFKGPETEAVSDSEREVSLKQATITQTQSENERISIPKKFYKAIISFAAASVVVIASVFLGQKKQCMYWTGDHYEPIACDQNVSTPVIALDTFSVSHLKKISDRDTITAASIGKVYYTKVKIDSVDFYTAKGDHPTNSTKRLLPMTQYILDKYVPNHK